VVCPVSRQTRWNSSALSPEVAATTTRGNLLCQILNNGHEQYLNRILDEAETSPSADHTQVAKTILTLEIATQKHDPRTEIVGRCNQIIHSDGGNNEQARADD
jgi:hypothetical protein